jgi:hypothetical protein
MFDDSNRMPVCLNRAFMSMSRNMIFGIALTALIALLPGCERKAVEADPEPAHTAPAPESASQPGGGCEPVAQLNTLDPRRPVPLQPMMAWHQKQNMQEHLVAIQRITDGLARQDWDEIAQASALIGTSPEMEQMCQHMGAGAEGFTELALEFHHRADAIAAAARAQDSGAVLEATSRTLQTCTSCHATYRQDVVDAATWQARTGSTHAPMMKHGSH